MNRIARASINVSLVAAAAVPALADFSTPFFFDTPDVVRNGAAVFDQGQRLTTGGGQAGSLWHTQKQSVATGFVTTFQFRIEAGPAEVAGDGFAFVIQDQLEGTAALGGGGSDLGFNGLNRSVAVEFDTFWFSGEPQGVHVSVQIDGSTSEDASLGSALLDPLGVNILDGRAHTATVQYVPPVRDAEGQIITPGDLDVYIDSTFILSVAIDLEDVNGTNITDDSGQATVGFTAGTGLADSIHVVSAWAFNDDTGGECVAPEWYVAGSGAGGLGSTAEFSVQFTGTRAMTFTWYYNDAEITDDRGGRISGLGTDTLRVANLQIADAGTYYCTAVNICGSSTTAPGALLITCPADFNLDANIDPDDLGDFINCFFSLPPCERADFNHDSNVDPDDLGDFINAFFSGGCG
ncbi:MAG: immunoglobulin domain-containing protein [Phycisphaerales bacterium]